MIEKSLQKWLRPVVSRRRKLYVRRTLAIYWFAAALMGVSLFAVEYSFGLSSSLYSLLLVTLGVATIGITITTWFKSLNIAPDYKAIARSIERLNPDLQATLLTAIEQKPRELGGQLSYLQERVIGEALVHARAHDWMQSIPQKTIIRTTVGQVAALILFLLIFSQLIPSSSGNLPPTYGTRTRNNYTIEVNPGDTNVELGSPVVFTARFNNLVPDKVDLVIGTSTDDMQIIPLEKPLADPVFGATISQIDSNKIYYIEYAGERTRDYTITTFQHPELERADAKVVYPSYTELPEKTVKDMRRVGVLEGSEVTLTFMLNKPVDTAELVGENGDVLELDIDPEESNVYTTVIVPWESQRYELNLVDSDGRTNKIPPRFMIDIQENLPVDLRLTFPNRDLEASPIEELTFEAELSDDFGIIAQGLGYNIPGYDSRDINITDVNQADKQQVIDYLLELEELAVQPNQLLTYYFWAEDIGPEGDSRRSLSDLYFTEIRPFEEIFRESQSFQDEQQQQQEQEQQEEQQQEGEQQQNEDLIELQKQIITATWNIKRETDQMDNVEEEQAEDMDLVRESQANALEQAQTSLSEAESPEQAQALSDASVYMQTSLEHLTEAAETLSTDELMPALSAEQAAYQELLKLRERENEVARSQNNQQNNSNRSERSQEQLQQLELRENEERYETERLAQAEQEQATQSEDLQVLNRLRELARRESETADRLREAEAALREAQTQQEREEIERELSRLREEQIEALRDVEELQQRMESPQNQQRMANEAEQLSETRDRIQQSAEELEQGQVSEAVASTTRAQRELEEMRDEFQSRTSGQFSEQMRNMREQAQQLDERQSEISEEMRQETESGLRPIEDSNNLELADRLQQQIEELENLLQQMREVSEESEVTEPVLSRRLYDTLRQTTTENVDRALETTEQLVRNNFILQAMDIEEEAREGIENLREGIEEAASSILGDEADALRLAREQLDELIRQINQEAAEARGEFDPNQQQAMAGPGQGQGDPNQSPEQQQAMAGPGQGQGDPNQSPEQQQAMAGPGQEQGDPNQSPEQQQAMAGPGQGQGDPNQSPEQQQAMAGPGQRQGEPNQQMDRQGQPGAPRDDQRAGVPNRPLTGEDFRQWSDRLRDVEEMLSEQELREEVANVRDRAREIRQDYTRYGEEPQWDVVEMDITRPLVEVRSRVEEELQKIESRDAPVPIDRDPVPDRYADLVQSYYENLGGGD